ncbi:MAG: hypothetical protein WC580_10440, partial [Agrococcus sp.]
MIATGGRGSSAGGMAARTGSRVLVAAAAAALLLSACSQGSLDPAPVATDPVTQPSPSVTPSATPTPTPEPSTVSVSAMGDMLPHDSVTMDAQQPDGSYDYGQFFDAARPIWEDS